METSEVNEKSGALEGLCETVKNKILSGRYDVCYGLICEAMSKYPDSAVPHNLLGIWYEKEGAHAEAIKHFRAAYALDPTYAPASQNLETYGTFYSTGRCAFTETDCVETIENTYHGESGFIVRRTL